MCNVKINSAFFVFVLNSAAVLMYMDNTVCEGRRLTLPFILQKYHTDVVQGEKKTPLSDGADICHVIFHLNHYITSDGCRKQIVKLSPEMKG